MPNPTPAPADRNGCFTWTLVLMVAGLALWLYMSWRVHADTEAVHYLPPAPIEPADPVPVVGGWIRVVPGSAVR